MTTVSLPAGSTPPVKMRAVSPALTWPANGRPAATSPISLSRAGAFATSSARTAYPSIAETSSGGCVRRAARSSERTRPSASLSATRSAASGSTRSSTRASASATGSSATLCSLREIRSRFAAAFLDQADALDAHAALHRLLHIVDRDARDGHRRARLHLDAGLAGELAGPAHNEAGQLAIRRDVDFDL